MFLYLKKAGRGLKICASRAHHRSTVTNPLNRMPTSDCIALIQSCSSIYPDLVSSVPTMYSKTLGSVGIGNGGAVLFP